MAAGEEEISRIIGCDERDWRGILGVPGDADEVQIKKAYKKLALVVHPDKSSHARAREAFVKVGNAYRKLTRGDDDDTAVGGQSRAATYEEAEEIFREFMKSNDVFRAGFQAGMGDVNGAATFNLGDMFSGKFNFSKASLGVAWASWEVFLAKRTFIIRALLYPVGIIGYFIASAFVATLPWSLVAVVLLFVYFFFKMIIWVLFHLSTFSSWSRH